MEELLQEEEEAEAIEEVKKDTGGYNVWVSLFYDPDRRFSVIHPVHRASSILHRAGNSIPPTPSGAQTPNGLWAGTSGSSLPTPLPNGGPPSTPIPNGGVGSTPLPNGGAAGGVAHGSTPTSATPNGIAGAAVDDVRIRIPPNLAAATPATLLRGDGALHNNVDKFSFSNPRGFFGWVQPIFKLKDKDYREVSGQDAVNYLNFQRYCIVYLSIVTLLSCCVILPLNIHGNLRKPDEEFGKTTISNLKPDDKHTWVRYLVLFYI